MTRTPPPDLNTPSIDVPLEIPEGHGEFLVAPAVDPLTLAWANHRRLGAARASIDGRSLAELRALARSAALPLARAYTEGLERAPEVGGDLLLATGHQPGFPHPGIWVKYLLLDRLSRGHTGLVAIVDSDAMERVGVHVPCHGTFLERREEVLRTADPDGPYETEAVPTREEWSDFLARVDRCLRTVREAAIRARWAAFRDAPLPPAATLTAFLTLLRGRHEGSRRYLEVPISQLASTEAFRALVLHVVRNAERFAAIHNRHLEAYRVQQHIRTEAQPFSNLDVGEGRVELPFWIIVGGRRVRVYLDLRANAIRPQGGAPMPMPVATDDPAFDRLPFRPRALTLTGFMRLLVSDLFIHGISGARYDRVTDAVMAEFLDLTPPSYLAASATLHLPFHESVDPEAQRREWQRTLLDAHHNPERMLTDPTPSERALIEEKWRHIRFLQEGPAGRRERRAATQAVRDINQRLGRSLLPRVAEIEAALRGLDDGTRAIDAAAFRGYPYFLFDLHEVEALVDRMVASAGGAAPNP